MPAIIPAILTDNFSELQEQISRIEGIFPIVQLDIMDGNFVPGRSFDGVNKLGEISTGLQYELHLMVNDAAEEMKKWVTIKNVKRVIAHLEAPGDIEEAWSFAKKQNWEFGIAVNPDTPLTGLDPHLNCIDLVLFMTVYPGKQGAPFQTKVLDKIREYLKLAKHPPCAIDGGINLKTIGFFKDLPVDTLCIGSALVKTKDVSDAYAELKNKLMN